MFLSIWVIIYGTLVESFQIDETKVAHRNAFVHVNHSQYDQLYSTRSPSTPRLPGAMVSQNTCIRESLMIDERRLQHTKAIECLDKAREGDTHVERPQLHEFVRKVAGKLNRPLTVKAVRSSDY